MPPTNEAPPEAGQPQPAERLCRYVGRDADTAVEPGTDGHITFGDTALPADLADAMQTSNGVVVLDPMSFPWNSIDLDIAPPVVVDLSTCTADDVVALRDVLSRLTPADTIIDSRDRSAVSLSETYQTRTTAPSTGEWADVHSEKQIMRFDRAIAERAAHEVGDQVILYRVNPGELVSQGQTVGDHLAEAAQTFNAHLVGVWGVHPRPGAPLHHGWAVYEPVAATN